MAEKRCPVRRRSRYQAVEDSLRMASAQFKTLVECARANALLQSFSRWARRRDESKDRKLTWLAFALLVLVVMMTVSVGGFLAQEERKLGTEFALAVLTTYGFVVICIELYRAWAHTHRVGTIMDAAHKLQTQLAAALTESAVQPKRVRRCVSERSRHVSTRTWQLDETMLSLLGSAGILHALSAPKSPFAVSMEVRVLSHRVLVCSWLRGPMGSGTGGITSRCP